MLRIQIPSLIACLICLVMSGWPSVLLAQESAGESDSTTTELSIADQMIRDHLIELDTATTDAQRSMTMGNFSALLHMVGDYTQARVYADSAMALALRVQSDSALLGAHYAAFKLDRREGKSKDALEHAREWARLMKASRYDSVKTGSMYKVLGMAQFDRGLYHNALDTLLISLDLLENHSTGYSVSTCLDVISNVYGALGNTVQQVKFQDRAVEELIKAGGSRNLPALLLNSSGLSLANGDYDKAKMSIDKAEKIALDKGYANYTGKIANRRGELAAARGNYQTALSLYQEAKVEYQSVGDTINWMANEYDRAHTLKIIGQDSEAYEVLLGLSPIIERTPNDRFDAQIFLLLAQLAEDKGQIKNALAYRKKYERSTHVVDSLAAMKQALDLEARFRHTQQELKISEGEKEIGLKNAEIKESAAQNRMLIVGLLGAGLLAISIFFLYRQRLRSQSQKSQIKLNQALIESTEEERERIARELHDGTGSLLTGIKLGLERISYETQDSNAKGQLERSIALVKNVSQEVRRVSHAMAPSAIDRLAFKEVLNDLITTFSSIGTAEIDYATSGDLDAMNKTERLMLYRILQECLNNSFKHSKATEVTISISVDGREAELLFQDNGVGYDPKTKSAGIGLSGIEKRIRYLNGKRSIETDTNAGMLMIINFPILRK